MGATRRLRVPCEVACTGSVCEDARVDSEGEPHRVWGGHKQHRLLAQLKIEKAEAIRLHHIACKYCLSNRPRLRASAESYGALGAFFHGRLMRLGLHVGPWSRSASYLDHSSAVRLFGCVAG